MNDDVMPHAEELSTSTCWSLLRSVPVGRIALHGVDDEIEIFPINFIVDHGSIVFTTATGTKLSLADDGGRVAFEADGFDVSDGTAWSVVLRGTSEPTLPSGLVEARRTPLFDFASLPEQLAESHRTTRNASIRSGSIAFSTIVYPSSTSCRWWGARSTFV